MIYTYDHIVSLRAAIARLHEAQGVPIVTNSAVELQVQSYILAGLDQNDTIIRIHQECDKLEQRAKAKHEEHLERMRQQPVWGRGMSREKSDLPVSGTWGNL